MPGGTARTGRAVFSAAAPPQRRAHNFPFWFFVFCSCIFFVVGLAHEFQRIVETVCLMLCGQVVTDIHSRRCLCVCACGWVGGCVIVKVCK